MMKLRILKTTQVFLLIIFLGGCTYSQLASIQFKIDSDIKNKPIIEWTWIYNDGIYKIISQNPYKTKIDQYYWDRKVIPLTEGKSKWTFTNSDGCLVEYITYTDKDGDSIVSDAYIIGDVSKCEKRLPFSSQLM